MNRFATGILVVVTLTAMCPGQERKSYRVPFRLADTGHILVRMKINGKGPFNYVIDTGSPFTFVPEKTAKKLGLQVTPSKQAVADTLEIEGGVRLEKMKVVVHTPFQLDGMNAMNFAGVELHGMLGYDVLSRFRVEIDLTRNKLLWTPLDWKPPPPKLLRKKKGVPTPSLSVVAGIMKVVSWIVGKRPTAKEIPGGTIGCYLREEKGRVFVAGVMENSPASRAGLTTHDRLLRIGGKAVGSIAEVRRAVARMEPGDAVSITVERGGKELSLKIVAAKGL